jgi:hypothetical protein
MASEHFRLLPSSVYHLMFVVHCPVQQYFPPLSLGESILVSSGYSLEVVFISYLFEHLLMTIDIALKNISNNNFYWQRKKSDFSKNNKPYIICLNTHQMSYRGFPMECTIL